MTTKAYIILELLKSLNQGNSGSAEGRAYKALEQYDQMISLGIIPEEDVKGE